MWTALIGTVIFAGVLAAAALWLLAGAVRKLDDGRDEIAQPEDVAERLGALTSGQIFTDTAQRRAEAKRRLHLVAEKERGRPRIVPFGSPKGAA